MSLWLLLKKGEQQAQTLHLHEVGRTIGPPQKKFDVVLKPDINDSLFHSAEVGGCAAYNLLWKEGYIRTTATGRFRFDKVPPHINGKSADLLFALAFIIAAMPRREGYPPLAATGIIGKKGDVLSVGAVPAKLCAALDVLPEGGIIFYPRANEGEINAELIAAAENQIIELFPVENLNQAADRLGIPIRQVFLKEPYRGLHTFEYEHRAIYFGRDQEVERLRDRLINREIMNTPGILIVAASGAGKSSLVRAGLIPALEHGPNALPERPIIWAAWRPGDALNKDEAALVHSLLTGWQGQPGSMAFFSNLAATETLAELAEQLKHTLPSDRRFLWLIDQFEEFFTAGFDNNTLKSFAVFLKSLQKSGVWIVATLRGDFYGQYQQSPFLNCFGDNGIFNLSPLDKAALGQIIRGPAELADLDWELDENSVSLADRLLQDMGEKVDALPLLEFSLDYLFQTRRQLKRKQNEPEEDRQWQMSHASYQEGGRLMGAIGRYAETIFNEKLKQEARDSLYRLLWALTAADENRSDQQIAARPLRLYDFPKGAPVRDLIDVFTDERLLVQDRQEDNEGGIQVRVAHDALLNYWERAKGIIDGFIGDKQLHERLKGRMMEWKICPPDEVDSYLLKAGPALTKAEDLRTRLNNLLDDEVIEWIDASSLAEKKSKEAQLAFIEAEREKELHNQKRSVHKARQLATFMTLLFVGALGAGFMAWQGKQEAELNFDVARRTVDDFVYEISRNELSDIPGLHELREKFARKAIQQYADFMERSPQNKDVRIGYAKAKGTLGSILGDIGSIDKAIKEIQEAIHLLEADVKFQPREWLYKLELANSYITLGSLYWSIEKRQEALPYVELALQTLESISLDYHQDSEVIYSLAKAFNLRGNLSREMGSEDGGMTDYERSAELTSQIVDSYKDRSDALMLLSASIHNLSLIYKGIKDYEKSLQLLDESEKYVNEVSKLKPHSPDILLGQSISLGNRASVLKLMKKPELARSFYEKALKITQDLVKKNQKVTHYSWRLGSILKSYAGFLSSVGEYENSLKTYEEAASILEDVIQRTDDRSYYGVTLTQVLYSLASFHQGDKESIPKDEQAWKKTLDKMLVTAKRFAERYPSDSMVNFELSKAFKQMGVFEETKKIKNDKAAHDYYIQALQVYSEKVYSEKEPSHSHRAAEFLSFSNSAIYTAKRLNRIDDAKTITELAYQVGKTHTTMDGIQSLGVTVGVYGSMLQKAELYTEAIDARRKQLELTKPAWKKAKWNWWLRQQVGGANLHLAEIYQKLNDKQNEVLSWQEYMRIWLGPMYGVEIQQYTKINPSTVNDIELQQLREVANKEYGMKRFTIPTDFGGIKFPFHVYITNVPWPKDPLEDQARWVEEMRGGKIPETVRESFRKLHQIAHENNVSFTELAVYALESASENASNDKGKKTDKNSE